MYGENTRLLRDSLRELLTQHRIQQRIGGAGLHTVPETTSVTERREIGGQIGRYRHAVPGNGKHAHRCEGEAEIPLQYLRIAHCLSPFLVTCLPSAGSIAQVE